MYEDEYQYDQEDEDVDTDSPQFEGYDDPQDRIDYMENYQQENLQQQEDEQNYELDTDFLHEPIDQNQHQMNHYSNRQLMFGHSMYGMTRNTSIDNNIEAKYGDQISIKRIQYGFFLKDNFYKLPNDDKRGYQFPRGGKIKFRKQHQTCNTLEISDGKFYKIQIKISQISRIFSFPNMKMICICYNSPPQYYVNSQKEFQNFRQQKQQTQALLSVYQQFIKQKLLQKPNWRPFWKRILNIPLYNMNEKYPNQPFISHLLIKNGAIYIHLQNFIKSLEIITTQLFGFKDIEESNLQKQVLDDIFQSSYETIIKQYSLKNFISTFDFKVNNKRQKIERYEIMFSLISFLYTCKSKIGIEDIFKMAKFVKKLITADKQSIYFVWKAIKYLTPNNLETVAMNESQKIQRIIQQKINIIKSKGLKQFSKEDINQNAITVPLIKITPSGLLPSGWSTDLRNRMVRHYLQNDYQFMKIQILDDNGEKGSFCMFDDIFRGQINRKMAKISFLERQYIPLGWTQSQLKTASMWFTLDIADVDFISREKLLFFLGEFQHIKNPALKAARTGQNLSTGMSVNVKDATVQLYEDDKSGNYMYTDGIGMISADLIQRIQKQLNKQSTVYQVRFRGSKGILALNRQLADKTIVLRKSMKKFECNCQEALIYLDILDSSYHKTGYLNRQIILLLQSNGIQITNFIQIQRQYMQRIINLEETIDEQNEKNFQKSLNGIIYDENKNDEFKIQNIGQVLGMVKKQKIINVLKEPVLRRILCQKYRGMFEKLVKKSHIKIEKSARILGIIDEYGILQEDQVYCTIEKKVRDSEIHLRQNIGGKVMLTRNPCMHPSDIRVVTCLSKQEASSRFNELYALTNLFQNLPNCVIFPKAGVIPLTSQISGSDLDGDTFFITWDPRLIPKKAEKPYIADDIKPQQRGWSGSGYKQIISFFTQFISNDNLGRIGNSHLAKADREGVKSKDCLQLCEAYNKAVDYPKKGYKFQFQKHFKPRQYPHFMQKYDKKSYQSKSALGRVYNNAKDHYNQFVEKVQTKNIKIHFIPKFLTKKYSQKEIKYAIQCILDFNREIERILEIYQFERESQIYALSKNKQNKQKHIFLAELQLKFFKKFFLGLPLTQSAQDCYKFIRQAHGYLIKDEMDIIKDCIEDRLLLWYHILYHNFFFKEEKNVKWQQWLHQLNSVQSLKHIKLSEKAKNVGLLWFAVPCLTFIILKKYLPYAK